MRVRATILVVEDEQCVLHLVRDILVKDARYDVLLAGSAELGLRIGLDLQQPIDLLLADVVMPGMIGTDLASKLKEARPGMRVILMSGRPEGELLVLHQGWSFLKKPFVGEALLARIGAALSVRRAGA